MTQKEKQTLYILLATLLLVVVSVSSVTAVQLLKNKQQKISDEAARIEKQDRNFKQAEQLVKGYYYDEALALLREDESEKSLALQKEITDTLNTSVLWDDPGKISHLFYHSLVKDSQKAFKESANPQGYKDYMVTIPEFNASIEQLYQNGYVLINLEKLIKKNDKGELEFVGVTLPQGKKPLVLSQDDVSYYEYMKGEGFPTKLLLDENNQVKTLYQDDGKKDIGDYDMVPLIDTFVSKHPDFSYQGAKGIIALTGYNGVLGYRTSESVYGKSDNTSKEIAEAKKVATQMKQDGWTFASHAWGHIDMGKSSLADIKKDNELWQKEVAPIVGKTTVFIYPFGADISDWQTYSSDNGKFDYLKEQGFDIYCNVDATQSSWSQFDKEFYRNARINIDGIRFESELKGENHVLESFFDTKTVYDKEARSN
ncbi:polysaccharide deacetylase family protein [Vagococcus fluvialis]|uniref:polysaccharide deacetylase family protein n=1 Tax=Vagococcus fluvialis TaxID=2738 RepID=UPI003B5B96A3